MSKTRNTIYLVIIIILIILGISLYFYIKQYQPKYRWYEKYSEKYDQPYGLKLFYELLSDPQNKYKVIDVKQGYSNIDTTDTSSILITIGHRVYLTENTTDKLFDFIKKGNTVLISSIYSEHSFFSNLTNYKISEIELSSNYDTSVNVHVYNSISDSLFTFKYKFGKNLQDNSWYGISQSFFEDSLEYYGFKKISEINEGIVDCYKVKIGKGYLIQHNNPIFFTNYFLSTKSGFNYVNAILSDSQYSKIYWDNVSQYGNLSDEMGNDSIFRFIFSEKSLKWSWYLILITLLLNVLLNAKRKLPRIQLIPENRNTTSDYVNTIAMLHYQNNTLVYTSEEMMKQFLAFVRHKYSVPFSKELQEFIKLVNKKSGIPESKIEEIFKFQREIKYSQVPEKQALINMYNAIEYFYKNCK